MNDIVSIITPLFNCGNFIERTIQSVMHQTFPFWEMIIVDDGSTDRSLEIVRKYEKHESRIKVFSNSGNRGPAAARNKAIDMAMGRYIAFLDSDDIWIETKLEKQIKYMEEKRCYFSYTFYDQIDEDDNYIRRINDLPMKVSYAKMLRANKIGCLTAMYDVSFFGKQYMKNIKKRQDYVLWLHLLKKVEFAYCVPDILARYRIRKNSISSNKLDLIKYHWYIYREIEKKNMVSSFYYLTTGVVDRILR